MTDNPNSYRGSFIPFRRGFPVDDIAPYGALDTPRVAIHWNQFYTPYILGAIKALARPETFAGTPQNLESWVETMMQIVVQEPVPYPQVPNWSPVDTEESYQIYALNQRGLGVNGPFYVRCSLGSAFNISFIDNVTEDPVGGLLNVFRYTDTGGGVAVFGDCTLIGNQHHDWQTFGGAFDLISELGGPAEISNITMFCDGGDVMMQMIMKNDWTFEP